VNITSISAGGMEDLWYFDGTWAETIQKNNV
jgi:hypothetical protein